MIIQENTIIHGDSLTVLRQMEPESVDAIITDPPYGINYVSQTGASIKNDKSPFEEAVAYFKERVPVTASRFYQIAAEYRALAFTVSGYTKAQVLKKFYDELLAALEEGNSLAEFRENMNDFLEAEG